MLYKKERDYERKKTIDWYYHCNIWFISLVSLFPAHANTGTKADDTNYTISDVTNLQDFLLAKETPDLSEKNYDLNGDGIWDTFDLCLMKQAYTKQTIEGERNTLVAYFSATGNTKKIAGELSSLDAYSTIYLGYPIWWGDAPRIMSTFVESYDFSNQTIIPFCTSGSSKIDKSESNLKTQSGGGNWLAGSRLDADSSEEEIQSWIDGLS